MFEISAEPEAVRGAVIKAWEKEGAADICLCAYLLATLKLVVHTDSQGIRKTPQPWVWVILSQWMASSMPNSAQKIQGTQNVAQRVPGG